MSSRAATHSANRLPHHTNNYQPVIRLRFTSVHSHAPSSAFSSSPYPYPPSPKGLVCTAPNDGAYSRPPARPRCRRHTEGCPLVETAPRCAYSSSPLNSASPRCISSYSRDSRICNRKRHLLRSIGIEISPPITSRCQPSDDRPVSVIV